MSAGPPTDQSRTITVTGTGRVRVTPDLADLRLGVSVTEATIEAARTTSAKALTGVLDRLRALGIEDRDVQTSIVSVNPQYDYSADGKPPRLAGYSFTNLVAATIRDIGHVGDAIDAALTAGATNVDRIGFRVADQTAADQEAREAAVSDARLKAETYARAAGIAIAGVAAIVESGAPVPYPLPVMERMAFAAKDASTPIEPGENEVVASVTISYLIER